MRRWEQGGDAVDPLNDHHAAVLQEIGEAEDVEVFASRNAIGIEMKDAKAWRFVDVEQDERLAADELRIAVYAVDESADELGFAGALLADQRYALAAA